MWCFAKASMKSPSRILEKRFGASKKVAICLGTGKLLTFLRSLNKTHNFFKEIIHVEHPRYIVQYKRAEIDEYHPRYANLGNHDRSLK